MNNIKAKHGEAFDTLCDIATTIKLIQDRNDTIRNYEAMRLETDYIKSKLKELEKEKQMFEKKYKDQLSELNELINQV